MSKMNKTLNALKELKKINLELKNAIDETIFETQEGELVALYDWDGELEYKGIIIFSENKNKIGEIHWYLMEKLTEFYTLKNK